MSASSFPFIALVTGAAGGIGAAIVDAFLARGAGIVAVDRDAAALAALRERSPLHAGIRTQCADVADPEAMRAAVEIATRTFGGLDVAVLNAGIEGAVAPIDEYPTEVFRQVLRVNVRGVWCGLQASIPALKARGAGSIVMLSSISGVMGFPGVAAYTASKHAVIGLMRSASLELAAHRIRVNVVAPGFTVTRMTRDLEKQLSPDNPGAAREAATLRTPLKRYAQPTEIAQVVDFLSSDRASYCTGAVYPVDGGFAT